MYITFLYLLSPLNVQSAILVGNDIRVPITYDEESFFGNTYRIPAQFQLTNSSRIIRGQVSFALNLYRASAESSIPPDRADDSISSAREIILMDNQSGFFANLNSTNILVPSSSSSDQWATTSISVRARDFQSYLILFPNVTDHRQGLLIVNPLNVALYTSDRPPLYTTRVDESLTSFASTVSLVGPNGVPIGGDENPPVTYTLINPRFGGSLLPLSIMTSLLSELARIGSVSSCNRYITLAHLSERDRLPRIRFTLTAQIANNSFHLQMYPEDYLRQVGPGYRYELMVGGHRSNRCTLGHNFLRTMAIHFDHVNHQLGFGEPSVTTYF